MTVFASNTLLVTNGSSSYLEARQHTGAKTSIDFNKNMLVQLNKNNANICNYEKIELYLRCKT